MSLEIVIVIATLVAQAIVNGVLLLQVSSKLDRLIELANIVEGRAGADRFSPRR